MGGRQEAEDGPSVEDSYKRDDVTAVVTGGMRGYEDRVDCTSLRSANAYIRQVSKVYTGAVKPEMMISSAPASGMAFVIHKVPIFKLSSIVFLNLNQSLPR
jgi:hypothetical protein